MGQPQAVQNPVAALVTRAIESKPRADELIAAMERVPAVIETHEVNGNVGDMIKQLRAIDQALEKERTSIVKPIGDGVKIINAKFKKLQGPITAAMGELRKRQTAFLLEQQRLKDEAEAQAKREQVEAALEQAVAMEDAGDSVAAEQVMEDAEHLPPPVGGGVVASQGAFGTNTGLRDNWTWELEDISKVPPEYLEVNSVAVNKAIKTDKVRDIPGLIIKNNRTAVAR